MVLGLPAYQEILIWGVLLSVASTLISRFLANQHEIKKAKKDMEFYRKKSSEAQKSGDLKKANEHMGEMMKASQRQLRLNFKAMMFSFLVFIIALGWFGSAYAEATVSSPIPIPFVVESGSMSWFWWYILTVLPFSTMFRKLLDVS
ncbi:MAG TPA: EMC3/TMCO1 family protein [archaeon]|nr:EMC3/TMCO1 family protein [archaeon]